MDVGFLFLACCYILKVNWEAILKCFNSILSNNIGSTVDGTCDGISAGLILIEFNVGICDGYSEDADTRIGGLNGRQVTVTEIIPASTTRSRYPLFCCLHSLQHFL